MPERSMNYNTIARDYNRRYTVNDYSGVQKALFNFIAGARTGPVLEVGCGTGHWLYELAQQAYRVTGLDPSAGMLKEAETAHIHFHLVQARAEMLPFAEAIFDRLFCINAYHHFSNHPAFIAEAFRVLTPGGGLFICGLDPHTGLDSWCLYDYFPRVLEIDKGRFPPASKILDSLKKGGFTGCLTREAQHLPVKQDAHYALQNGLLDKSISSQLTLLSDEEYQQGIGNITKAIEQAEAKQTTLTLYSDLRLYATTGWKQW